MEPEAVTAFRQKMGQEKAKAIYKLRGAVAEFPNAWLKDKINLWKFRLRGLAKVTTEALWACFAYNRDGVGKAGVEENIYSDGLSPVARGAHGKRRQVTP